MIQRIQSLWLLFAAITILCLLFVPVFSTNNNGVTNVLNGMGISQTVNNVTTTSTNIALVISVVLAGLISLANVFNFKNRPVQKRIASVNILLILGLSFWLSQLGKQLPGGVANSSINAGLFLPLVAVIFTLLAIRGINNDEKLIRSADRLR